MGTGIVRTVASRPSSILLTRVFGFRWGPTRVLRVTAGRDRSQLVQEFRRHVDGFISCFPHALGRIALRFDITATFIAMHEVAENSTLGTRGHFTVDKCGHSFF